MKLQVVDLSVPCTAPPDIAFDILRDAANWNTWSAAKKTRLEKQGIPAPDGVGAVRIFGTGPFSSREEVVAYNPPTHFAYILHKGLPVRAYRADVTITPVGQGCTIAWHSTFYGKYPGTGALSRIALTFFLRDTAKRLAKAARENLHYLRLIRHTHLSPHSRAPPMPHVSPESGESASAA